ncbi:histidine kinase [Paucibacter sp. DJ1R-11]|uniref:sensor histidine kinase n=1 Tax=Paucibacter sp. DJ1R-11 TaxID=2893556 RepID=UPI0021E401A3|nr:histidine kinase [Paucibacter sp. DJ1R-11]MCV2362900.1 histidine kinase [Paucibacter sp. DJ1R-11]
MSAPSRSAGPRGPASLAARALREEFGRPALWPQLGLGLLGFGLSAPFWASHAAWCLALGLWLGCVLSQLLLKALSLCADGGLQRRGWALALPLCALAMLTGASAGSQLEQALSARLLDLHRWTQGEPLARASLHLGFVALLLGLPLLQRTRRLAGEQRLEQERDRVRAELQLLQAQIEPHFLFNTLATLRGLVRQQSSLALPLLDRTTAFLEAVLPEVRTADSTLGRELHIVEQYLAIMALRLGPRLRYRIDVDSALHALTLPPLLLQPLVENAIVHGIEPCESGGELLLQAIPSTQGLQLCVRNSGEPLLLRSPQAGQGLALANLRQRLQALYGHTAEFHLRSLSEGTEASLSLPLSPKAQTVS